MPLGSALEQYDFSSALQLSDHLFRMGTDTVEWPGTIDKGYFYCAVWLKGKG